MNALTDFVIDHVTLDDIVTAKRVGERLSRKFKGPDSVWEEKTVYVIDGLPVPDLPDLPAVDEVGEHFRDDPVLNWKIRDLVGKTKLRAPLSGLTQERLEAELRRMAGAGKYERDKSGLEDLYNIAGLAAQPDVPFSIADRPTLKPVVNALNYRIAHVAEQFAALATVAPSAVRLAFQGAIATASAELRTCCHRVMSHSDLIDALDELARFHLVDSLLHAGDEAHVRIFETTGLDFLDANGDSQTTKGCILKRMDDQLALLLDALRLFALGTDIAIGDRRLDRLRAFCRNGRMAALEDAFRGIYGFLAQDQIERVIKDLEQRIRKFRRALSTLRGQSGFRSRPAWTDRGPHPYHVLYLNCSLAAGWLDQHLTVRGEIDRDATNYSSSTRLQVAIRRAARGESYEPRLHRKSSGGIANRLFFTLRNIRVQDPRPGSAFGRPPAHGERRDTDLAAGRLPHRLRETRRRGGPTGRRA
jgi:hypothetical protein